MTYVRQAMSIGASELEAAFCALAPLLHSRTPPAPQQFYLLENIEAAFENLAGPLAIAAERGGLINPWAIAGLKRDEVRNAATFAGLWSPDFGGATSRRFLAAYLARAIAEVDWGAELASGYCVFTELTPLGDRADRVDLVIGTSRFLVGIEVKIDAGVGERQLERYLASIKQRADLQNLTPHVVFLAPFASPVFQARSTLWADVARAADDAAKCKPSERSLVQQLIVNFGAHVSTF